MDEALELCKEAQVQPARRPATPSPVAPRTPSFEWVSQHVPARWMWGCWALAGRGPSCWGRAAGPLCLSTTAQQRFNQTAEGSLRGKELRLSMLSEDSYAARRVIECITAAEVS